MNFIKMNKKRIALIILVFVLAFLGGAGLGKITDRSQQSIFQQVSEGKVVNILLMGIDARSVNENSRSDTMILASIDTKDKKVVMVWIPRDTRIVSASGRQAKINSVNFEKGPEAACETVGDLLGTRVDYYVITNFWGFSKIIDTLGGIDIDVEGDMKHHDPDPFLDINLSKGLQHLNGENALKYVRYRGGPTADIGRTERQAKFLKAVAKATLQGKNLLKLPQLVPQFMDSIKTNIPMSDLAYLATSAKDFESSQIITQTLPGYSFTSERDGGSYWEPDKKIADGIIDSLLAGKTFDVIKDPPSWVNKTPVVKKQEEPGPLENSTDNTDNQDGQKTDAVDQTGQSGTGSTSSGTPGAGAGTSGSGTSPDASIQPENSDGSINAPGPLEPDSPAGTEQTAPAATTQSGHQ